MPVYESLFVDVDGPVHVADFGGPVGAPVLLCVHGLGGSASGWMTLAGELAASHRVLAVDLPGHGRSPTNGRSVSVPAAARTLVEVVARLGVGPVTLVGHSMGAMVSVLAARRSAAVERVLLLAPPLPRQGWAFVTRAVLPQVALCLWPHLGRAALRRRLARQSAEDFVRDRLRLTCAPDAELSGVVLALAADLQATYDGGGDPVASFVEAARSVGLVVGEGRRYRRALTAVGVPVAVVQGAMDRVVDPAGLQQLRALDLGWDLHLLPDVGHSPHLEASRFIAGLLRPRRAGATRSSATTAAVSA